MKAIDMTEGKILPVVIRFAIPLMLGDLFQQLYIITDSAIVGQFVGAKGLAAVGATTFLIKLIIGLFVGISAGASVVIAQCVGAKNMKKLEEAIHIMAGLTILGSIILTAIGVGGSKTLLRLVSIPDDIMDEANIYLAIYFAGVGSQLIYNVGSGVLRAFGDSKRPFIYLIISSIVNVILDLVMIVGLKLGVAGAALATIISQMLSAVLVVYAMIKTKEPYHLSVKNIKIKSKLVSEILHMGLPAGLQSMIVALSNVMVQTHINHFGTQAIAGFGVFNKIDALIMLPINAISITAMTFTGQNYGAGKKKRILEGMKLMFLFQFITWLLGGGICLVFGNRLFYLFTNDAKVVYYAGMNMRICIPLYWAMGSCIAMTSIIRGMGKSKAASLIFIGNMCGMRQLWILFANWRNMGMEGVLLGYPISWILTLAGTLLYTLYLKKLGEFYENTDKEKRIFCIL